MDRLAEIIYKQKEFAKKYSNFDILSEQQKEEWTQKYILLILDEVHELLRETNFKPHKLNKKEINKENLAKEWIDIFCFWINIGLCWGLNDNIIYDKYIEVNKNNIERSKNDDYLAK